ncbi:MAG: hypothetical protein C5B53_01580 [Candidatus Melainabacteria bacterium]|nr:MAG: hypothetical protein C5B53_01580 [Candidatus Melainabacteria bacterium]
MPKNESSEVKDVPSCVPGISRKEFVTKLLTRAAIGGAVLALATEIDRHLLPPVSAATTSTGT